MSKKEILNIVNSYTLSQKLDLIRSIVDQIDTEKKEIKNPDKIGHNIDSLIEFAGIWDDDTALKFKELVKDCRKIDIDEW